MRVCLPIAIARLKNYFFNFLCFSIYPLDIFFNRFLIIDYLLFLYNRTLRNSQDKTSLNQNVPIIQSNTGSRSSTKQHFTLQLTFLKNTTIYQKVPMIHTIELPTTIKRSPIVHHKFLTIHQKIQTCHRKRREEDQASRTLPNQNFLPPERNTKM